MRMWILQTLLFSLCMALCCVPSAADLIHVFGYTGGHVAVVCPYESGYQSYEKYLCRNDCGSGDVVIDTTTRRYNSKYSIHDDRSNRVFTVTILSLGFTDSGKYWCGVTRTGKDIYTEVKLQVEQDSCCDVVTPTQSHEEASVTFRHHYESEDQNSLKYMCKGNQPSTCLTGALVTSRRTASRLTLRDDKASRTFTVTISDLTRSDSGRYLLGVKRNTGLDVFSAVELEVKEWCCVRAIRQQGIVGRPLTLRCSYPSQHKDNRKFLCKGDQRKGCKDMMIGQSRFTLQDDVSSGVFVVTVTPLRAGDAGTYWCGSDAQWGVGDYTKIQLSLVFPKETSTMSYSSEEPVGSQSTNITLNPVKEEAAFGPVVFIVPAVLLVVLASALAVLCRYKCHKAREAGVNMDRIKSRPTEEVIHVADIYGNQEVVGGWSRSKSPCDHYEDAGEDEEESDYQNFSAADDIYCNQFYSENRR